MPYVKTVLAAAEEAHLTPAAILTLNRVVTKTFEVAIDTPTTFERH